MKGPGRRVVANLPVWGGRGADRGGGAGVGERGADAHLSHPPSSSGVRVKRVDGRGRISPQANHAPGFRPTPASAPHRSGPPPPPAVPSHAGKPGVLPGVRRPAVFARLEGTSRPLCEVTIPPPAVHRAHPGSRTRDACAASVVLKGYVYQNSMKEFWFVSDL